MDFSKLWSSWCRGNTWGLHSMLVIFFALIAPISSFPTGTVITQTSLPDGTSVSDRPPSPAVIKAFVNHLQVQLREVNENFLQHRFRSTEPPLNHPVGIELLNSLPDISNLLPNKIVSSEDLPTRVWIHYRILYLFNRTMDNIIFDESQNNASHNFGDAFNRLQQTIGKVLAGILQTIHERDWESEEDGDITISKNLDASFGKEHANDILRNYRCFLVLSFFNQYLSTLKSDVDIL